LQGKREGEKRAKKDPGVRGWGGRGLPPKKSNNPRIGSITAGEGEVGPKKEEFWEGSVEKVIGCGVTNAKEPVQQLVRPSR